MLERMTKNRVLYANCISVKLEKNKNTKIVDQTELILMKPELNANIYNCIWDTIWEKNVLDNESLSFSDYSLYSLQNISKIE